MSNEMMIVINNFVPRDVDAWMLESPDMRMRIQNQILDYPCAVLPSLDDPAIITGIVHDMGVGEIWMITNDRFDVRYPTVIKQAREILKIVFDAFGLKRIVMRVDSHREDARKFVEYLGFSYSGSVNGYGYRDEDLDYYILKKGELI